jgi:hypothetical protein
MSDMHELLHGMAIKKHADAAALADLVGQCVAALAPLLERAVATGRAAEAQGKYLLTPAGHMILDGQYGVRCAALREDPAFVSAYDRFELINTELKQAITDWQLVDIGGKPMPNDHSDSDYDEKILDRLAQIHERVEPILQTFAVRSPRFTRYGEKLERALEQAEDGEHAWVSDATIESYHTVWFEMHEDLLRMLARVRDE